MHSAVMPSQALKRGDGSEALGSKGAVATPGTSYAIMFSGGRKLEMRSVDLVAPGPDEVVVAVEWSGISTGTERLLWTGEMPAFPGLTYPLVPGYEAVGRVIAAERHPGLVGQRVFVPGSRGFKDVAGLFGAAASHLVVAADKVVPVELETPSEGVLLALAATAAHALDPENLPELIVGHGVLGRLLARITVALGGAPTVWETDSERISPESYRVCKPHEDTRQDYRAICDVSGDSGVLDTLIGRLAPRGEITLAGFYTARPDFAFPPAFMKEMRLRVAAEWAPEDLVQVLDLLAKGVLKLEGLITHVRPASEAADAYRIAFGETSCLKMILDWRHIE